MRANYIMKGLSKNLRTRLSGLGLPTTWHSILYNVSAILPLSLAKEYVLKLIRPNTNTIRAIIPSHTRPRSKGRCGAQRVRVRDQREDVAHFQNVVFTFLRGKLSLTLSELRDYCFKIMKEILVARSLHLLLARSASPFVLAPSQVRIMVSHGQARTVCKP